MSVVSNCEGTSDMSTRPNTRTTISFAGCGFMGMYHVGCGMCIQEHAEDQISKIKSWYGASAGSIVSVAAACGIRATEGYKFIRKLHDDIYKHKFLGKFGAFHPSFDLMGHVRKFLESVLPKDAHRKCRNKVGVSLTVLPSLTNWIITDFNTRAELIQAVVCSCFIPIFAGIQPPKFRGKICCDGGLSNNLPYSSDPSVITVSPFSGECDICPNGETETPALLHICGQVIQSSWKNVHRGFGAILFYPWKEMDEVCAQGFRDAYNFIKREGIKPSTVVTVLHDTTTTEPVQPTPPIVTVDDDSASSTSDYFSIAHSRQSSVSYAGVTCLDELLDELEERRDSSILFVEEELSEVERDNDSEQFHKSTQKFQLRWKLKPKALFRNGSSVVSSVSNRWHSFLETVSEYQNDEKMWQFLSQSSLETSSSSSFLPLAITS